MVQISGSIIVKGGAVVMPSNPNRQKGKRYGKCNSNQLQATTTDTPQMTFDWSFGETREALKVVCNYGGATDTSNVATALIPWNSGSSVPMTAANNPNIVVTGSVSAIWYNDGYAVSFAGNMNYPSVNDIAANPCLVGYSPYGEIAKVAMKK